MCTGYRISVSAPCSIITIWVCCRLRRSDTSVIASVKMWKHFFLQSRINLKANKYKGNNKRFEHGDGRDAAGRLGIERCRETDSRNGGYVQTTLVDGLFLMCKEVCNRLHISSYSLQHYRNRKIIPYTQFAGKILYKESLLEKNVGGEFLFKLI